MRDRSNIDQPMTTQEINENEYLVVYHSCSKSTYEYPEQQGMNKEQGDEENNKKKEIHT